MKAVEISSFGGPEVLRLVERPTPSPGLDEVLVRVAAAGVNRPDLVQRQGKYPPPEGASDLPGLEIAGVIEAFGPSSQGVPRRRVGDRVMALVSGGGYAEFAAVPLPQCLPIPDGLTMVEAAAMPETFFTVWTNVFERGRLASGEVLLVHGGSSGIGTTAIQLARARGARVLVTAGSADKCAACERLGAERAINYKTEDFVALTRAVTNGRGADVILDMVGGPYVARNLDALAIEGRLVQIALMAGATAEINLGTLMRRRLTLTGSTLRPRSVAEKGAIARALETHVWPLVARGDVRPVIHATMPLADAAAAHQLLEEGHHVGKIVLTVAAP
jgi:putative PIG3 family NAD(P)H quinone oxidoreductase